MTTEQAAARQVTRTRTAASRWQPPLIWRFVLSLSKYVIPIFCRLRVTTSMDYRLTGGALILAGNHIGNWDPIVTTAACAHMKLAPRMMATGGLFRAPLVGRFMRAAGHIRVNRGSDTVTNAVDEAVAALQERSIVFVYPEGRIGLDPAMWPEKARTGLARLALGTGTPVVPVAIWGSHEVIAYHGWRAMIRSGFTSIFRRPVVRIHFGAAVDLSDLTLGAVGHAQRASERIMDAITAELARLRKDEPGIPRHRDHTRPVTTARSRAVRPAGQRRGSEDG